MSKDLEEQTHPVRCPGNDSAVAPSVTILRANISKMDWVTLIPIFVLALIAFPLTRPTIDRLFPNLPSFVQGLLVGAAFIPIILPFKRFRVYSKLHSLDKVASRLAGASDMEYVTMLSEAVPIQSDKRVIKHLMKLLCERKLFGSTVLLWASDRPPPPGSPINVQFGPIPLHDADPAFYELESASNGPGSEPSDTTAGLPQSDILLRRIFTRSVSTVGGRLIVSCYALGLVIGGLLFILNQQMYGMLLVSAIVLASIFSVPYARHLFGSHAWLMVPAGLVRRKGKGNTASSLVHLYKREQSFLVLRPFSQSTWHFSISDADGSDFGQVSKLELSLLLRAWLSPLSPPPVEKLVDLT